MRNDIDKKKVAENLKEMISLLEFDSQRSAGKAKMNSQHLHSMYWLLEHVYKDVPAKKPTVKKED